MGNVKLTGTSSSHYWRRGFSIHRKFSECSRYKPLAAIGQKLEDEQVGKVPTMSPIHQWESGETGHNEEKHTQSLATQTVASDQQHLV